MNWGTICASGAPSVPSNLSFGSFKLTPGFGAIVAITGTEYQKEAELLEENVETHLWESQVLKADIRRHSGKY